MMLLTSVPATQAVGQQDPLPLSGSLAYRLLVFEDDLPNLARFAGRIGLATGARTYVGFFVGSWTTYHDCGAVPDPGCRDSDLQAVEYQLYVQQYLTRGVFVRAGGGWGDVRTVLPASSRSLRTTFERYPAWSGGLGWDSPTLRRISLTAAADITGFAGADGPPDGLSRAISLGLALSIR